MPGEALRLLVLGAHPDDAEFHSGGLAAIYRRLGHEVKLVSATDGRAGHHQCWGDELASRRRHEAAAAAAVIGAQSAVWDWPDGELTASLELRRQVIAEMRTFRPDLVLTHRTNDYHPDHRAVGQAVQDASYLVTVPSIVPEVPALRRDPVILAMPDRFTRPAPLAGDVVIDVTEQLDQVVRMLACHESQFFEWLPYNRGAADEVPTDPAARLGWLAKQYRAYMRPMAERYRAELIAAYGLARGSQIEYAEVYEVSQYAAPLDAAARERLFPMLTTLGDSS
jgi:N-acetylglucosamine malate deacetylase 1